MMLFTKLVIIIIFIILPTKFAYSLNQGIDFQALINAPDGTLVNSNNLTVKAKILSSNYCILRDEEFNSIEIINGYLSLKIGTGTVSTNDPGFLFTKIFNNSSTFNPLVCINLDGTTNTLLNSYSPALTDSRKLRIEMELLGTPIVGDFELNSVPYSIDFLGELSGDITGTQNQTKVTKIQGFPISTTIPVSNNFLKWNGSSWVPSDITSLEWSKLDTSISSLADLTTRSASDLSSGTLPIERLPALSGDVTSTSGSASVTLNTVAINKGGTGQTTASAGFNALSPLTTKGDIIAGNGTNSATRLGVGTDGSVLVADSSATSGLKYDTITNILSYTPLNKAGDTMSGTLDMGANIISNIADPANAQDAVTKNYSDSKLATRNLANIAPTTGQVIRWNGNQWEPAPTISYVYKSATGATVTNSTTSIDDSQIKFTALENTNYYFDLMIRVQNNTTTNTILKFGWDNCNGSSAEVTSWQGMGGNTNAATASYFSPSTIQQSMGVTMNSSTSIYLFIIKGSIQVGATGGLVCLKWAQNVAATATTTSILPGSMSVFTPF